MIPKMNFVQPVFFIWPTCVWFKAVTLVRALNPWVCCACGNVLGHILISIRFPCSNTMFLQICWAIWICKVWLWKRSIFNCGRLFLRRQICWTLLFSSHRNVTQIDQIVLGGIFIQGKVAEQWNSKTTFFMQSLPNSLDQLAIFTRYRQQVLTCNFHDM